jgi:hypothetical protein
LRRRECKLRILSGERKISSGIIEFVRGRGIGSLKKLSFGDYVHGYYLDNQKFHIPLA